MSLTLHTNKGDLKLELNCRESPQACKNVLALAASNYYDNSLFHRNIKGFIVQGGMPFGKNSIGESIWGGDFADEFHPSLKHNKRGIVSLANKGPNTNRSQFFITYDVQPDFDNVYTIIGHVLDGFDTLQKMENEPTDEKDRPKHPITINSVTVHANPFALDSKTLL